MDWSKVDLSDIPERLRVYMDAPALVLGHSRREMLGMYLNPRRQDVSDQSLLKDWRGMAEKLGFTALEIDNFNIHQYPTANVLGEWQKKQDAKIGQLLLALSAMGRFDILENTQLMTVIEDDIRNFIQQEERRRQQEQNPVQDPRVHSSEPTEIDEYSQITVNESPGNPEYFDAFVCYTSADFEFVQQLMNKLEGQHRLKLCVPNRDLVAGCATYTIMTKLIKERCRKVIIILSPEYNKNDECDFITKFAVTLSPGAREKKLIPVVYKPKCIIPDILSPICLLDYTRCDVVDWFWNRLANSLKKESVRTPATTTRPHTGPQTAPVAFSPRPPHPVFNHTAPVSGRSEAATVRKTHGDQLVLSEGPQDYVTVSHSNNSRQSGAQGGGNTQGGTGAQRGAGTVGGAGAFSDPLGVNQDLQHFGMNPGEQSRRTGPMSPRRN